MNENEIHHIINVQDAATRQSASERAPITRDNDPVLTNGLVTSETGEDVLLGSKEASAALQGLTKVNEVPSSLTSELTSDERQDILHGKNREQTIPRATIPANRRYGSEDVGGVPTTTPGPRQVRVEAEAGSEFKMPNIGTIDSPGEKVPLDQTTPEDRATYLDRALNRK
jgi:hypothetical protein